MTKPANHRWRASTNTYVATPTQSGCTRTSNPFTPDRVEEFAYVHYGFTWPMLLERLEQRSFLGSIVGPEGVGKTRLLKELSRRLGCTGMRPHLVLHSDRAPAVPWKLLWRLGPKDVLLFDDADLVPYWKRIAMGIVGFGCGGLVVTSKRLGVLKPIVTLFAPHDLLRQLLAQSLPGADDEALAMLAMDLSMQHEANVRECLRDAARRYESGDLLAGLPLRGPAWKQFR